MQCRFCGHWYKDSITADPPVTPKRSLSIALPVCQPHSVSGHEHVRTMSWTGSLAGGDLAKHIQYRHRMLQPVWSCDITDTSRERTFKCQICNLKNACDWPVFVIVLKHWVIKFRIAKGVLREYLIYFHQERNHQGKGNVLLFPLNRQLAPDANRSVRCRERLGALLKYYHRETA